MPTHPRGEANPPFSLSGVARGCQGLRVGSPGLDYCCSHLVSKWLSEESKTVPPPPSELQSCPPEWLWTRERAQASTSSGERGRIRLPTEQGAQSQDPEIMT
ncbi:hypothetical protein VULLAG_LOCUS19925 [Vulpes lagopus]